MSVNNTIKEEILAARISGKCCKEAFLAGVVLGCGSLPIERNGLGLILQHPAEELIQKCCDILSSLTNKEPFIVKKDKEMSLGQRVVYEIRLPAEVASPLLQELGLYEPPYGINDTIKPDVVGKPCCKKCFLRGVFSASGLLNISSDCQSSNSKGYNLDIVLASQGSADFVAALMTDIGIQPAVRSIKNNYYVYLKDSEKISDFCIALGANSALYMLNNIIASRSLRNNANRRTNCEVANIDKTLSASAKQLAAIDIIEKRAGLSYLDDALRDTAEMRRTYPDATLNELIKHLRYPTSKSGLNHRLRKIIEIADSLGEKND